MEKDSSTDKEKDMIDPQGKLLCKERLSSDFNDNGKRSLIIASEGTELSEISQMADVMRRAGVSLCISTNTVSHCSLISFNSKPNLITQISVVIASLDDTNSVRSSGNVIFDADVKLTDISNHPPFDILVLPGGLLGAKYLGEVKSIRNISEFGFPH